MFKPKKRETAIGFEPATTQFVNEHSAIQLNWSNDSTVLQVLIRKRNTIQKNFQCEYNAKYKKLEKRKTFP